LVVVVALADTRPPGVEVRVWVPVWPLTRAPVAVVVGNVNIIDVMNVVDVND